MTYDAADPTGKTLGSIEAIQTVLRVLQRVTGLRVSFVTRVVDESWTACAILDEALVFGMQPGESLPFQTTF